MRARTAMNQNWTPRVSTEPAMKTGMVRLSRLERVIANRNSFQENANEMSAVAADAGGGEGEGDPREGGPVGPPVDEHRLLELEGQVEEGLAEDHDREGEDEGRIDEDEGELGVEEAEGAHHEVEGDDGRDRRQDALGEKPDRDVDVRDPSEAEAGEGVGGRGPERQGEHGRPDRHDGAVRERAARLRGRELRDPVVEGRLEAEPGNPEARHGERVDGVAKPLGHRPVEREEEGEGHAYRDQPQDRLAEAALSGVPRGHLSHSSLAGAGR